MDPLRWGAVVFLAFLVQTHFSFFSVPLNLSILPVYAFALRGISGKAPGLFGFSIELKCTTFGAFVGLFEDVLAGGLIGPELFGKGVVAFLTAVTFSDILFRWTPVAGMVALLLANIVDGAVSVGLRSLFTHFTVSWSDVMQALFVQSLITLPFGILLKPADVG